MRNSRLFLAVTLISQLWFYLFANAAVPGAQHNNQSQPAGSTTPLPSSTTAQRAEQGDANAQYHLGMAYLSGKGVPQNDTQAFQWLRKAAEQDLPDAQFALGYLYEEGRGVARDYRQARVNYEAAANHGLAIAQNNLAAVYQRGEGVPKDLRKAAAWYEKAARGECIFFAS